MKNLIIYHAHCPDGKMSHIVTKKALEELGAQTTAMACSYGSELALHGTYDSIYIVDFSFDPETTRRLADQCNRLVVLDHHKSAAANFEGVDLGREHKLHFEMGKAGAMLAWEHFYPGKPAPDIVKYIQDRDLWKHELPGTKEVSAFMRCLRSDEEWHRELVASINNKDWRYSAQTCGAYALDAERRAIDYAAKASLRAQIEVVTEEHASTYNVRWCVGASNHSDICHRMLELDQDADFAVFLALQGERGEDIKLSLRARGDSDLDLLPIAKALGGGGHPHACGTVLRGESASTFLDVLRAPDGVYRIAASCDIRP